MFWQRKFLSICLIVVLGILVAGCGGQKADNAGENVPLQELVIGEQFDLRGYDPSSNMSDFVRALVFNNLVELDLDFKLSSGLAERWEMSPDGQTWTFYLRPDVYFHDGTPWNAEAAIINLERLMKGAGRTWLAPVETMESPDPLTLVLHLSKPVFTFASDITPPFLAMVSPEVIAEDGSVTAAVGTGPFKLVDWQKDSEFVMERNDQYFAGAPQLEKLTFKVIPDPETRAMALEAGQIDMMSGREALTAIQRLSKKPEIKIVKAMGQTSEVLFFNIYEAPFDDVRVRQAVAAAVDFSQMVPALLGDLAEPPVNFFSTAFGDFVQNNPSMPQYDPLRAKALLEEGGWIDKGTGIREKEGKRLATTLYYGAKNAEDKLLSTAMQSILKEIGMEVELRPLEAAALRQALENKEYGMIMIGQWHVPNNDPTTHYSGYWSKNSPYTIYTSPELEEMISNLQASLDAQERIKYHHMIQEHILKETPFLVVFHRNNVMAMENKVENFRISVGTWQIFRGLTETYIK